LPNIGRFGARFEAISWEEVGRLMPTSNLYKPGVLGSIKEVQKREMLRNLTAKDIFMQGSH
jgi:hypothetical protein